MPRRRFSTPPGCFSVQCEDAVRHMLLRAHSAEGWADEWMVVEREEYRLPPRGRTDSIPLSQQPSIEAFTTPRASYDDPTPPVQHLPKQVKVVAVPQEIKEAELSIEVEEVEDVIRPSPEPTTTFVYKRPSVIVSERQEFPFKPRTHAAALPTICVQAPTPRNVSASTQRSVSLQKELAPLPFPLIASPLKAQIVRPPSPATTIQSSAPSFTSTLVPVSSSSHSNSNSNSHSSHHPAAPNPTPRELAERSERGQTLSDAVMRSRAYSALMERHCHALSAAVDTTEELQAAKAEIRILRAKLAKYKDVNRSLVDWGLTLRDENEVLRAAAGDGPGVSLFDPERDLYDRDEEGAYEEGYEGEEEEGYEAQGGCQDGYEEQVYEEEGYQNQDGGYSEWYTEEER